MASTPLRRGAERKSTSLAPLAIIGVIFVVTLVYGVCRVFVKGTGFRPGAAGLILPMGVFGVLMILRSRLGLIACFVSSLFPLLGLFAMYVRNMPPSVPEPGPGSLIMVLLVTAVWFLTALDMTPAWSRMNWILPPNPADRTDAASDSEGCEE